MWFTSPENKPVNFSDCCIHMTVFPLLYQGWRKQFHIGQANSSSIDIHVWKAGLPTGFREPDVQVLLCKAPQC